MIRTEINELLIKDILKLLIDYDICNGTSIYYNNKRLWCNKGESELSIDNIRVEDCLEYCNPETVNLYYEGIDSLFLYINRYEPNEKEEHDKADRIYNELYEVGKKYGMWFDLGSDNILFFIDDNDDSFGDIEKFHYPK